MDCIGVWVFSVFHLNYLFKFRFLAAILKFNPIPKHRNTVIQHFVFKHPAVFLDSSRRGDIVFVTAHKHLADSELAAFVKCQRDHLCAKAFSALARTDAIADMPVAENQGVIQVMADVDCADKDIPLGIKAEEGGIRHVFSVRFFTSRLSI